MEETSIGKKLCTLVSYIIVQSSLHESRGRTLLQHQWVSVHTGHQAEANGSAYGLCNLALVLGPQARVFGMADPTRLGHVLGHHGEVLRRVVLVTIG